MANGWFDPEIRANTWFDVVISEDGWFDPQLLNEPTGGAPPAGNRRRPIIVG